MSVETGYSTIQDMVHGYLLPAIDRASVNASRLRALSRTPDIPMFDVDETLLSRILQDLDILRLLGHSILTHAGNEMRQFKVFSDWLATQVKLLGAEAGSPTATEAAEKAAGVDYAQLLPYITGPLTKSQLNIFLGRTTDSIRKALRRIKYPRDKKIIVRMLDRHRKEATQPTGPAVELINLLYQVLCLGDSCQEVIVRVPEGFARHTEIVRDVVLEKSGMSETRDMRMIYEVS